MNQSNKTNQESVNTIQNTILTTIDKLYNYGFRPDQVSFILFILILFRDGFFNQYKYDKNLTKAQLVKNSEKLRNDINLHIESLPDKNNFKEVLDVYSLILEKLEENLYIIIQYLNEHIDTKLLQENFSEIFDTILNKLVVSQGKYGYLIIQPLELTRLIISLAQLPKGATVYNPFAGCASFGVFLGDGYRYTGQEYNSNTWAIGYLRLLAYEKRNGNEFQLSDSIEYWNPKNEKYDFIVAHPPFGVRFLKPKIGRFGGIKNSEHFFIEKGIEDLTSDGKLIAVISNDILFRKGSEYDLRKYLIENDLIEMLISFPRGLLLYTMTPFSVIVINKNKKQKGVIQFVDAENFIERISKREKRIKDTELFSFIMDKKETDKMRIVGNDEIAQDDFNLIATRYLSKEDTNENVKFRLLKDIVTSRPKEGAVQAGITGRYIRVRDLRTGLQNAFLNVDELELADIPMSAFPVKSDSLLISLKFSKLKPTVIKFNQSEETVFVSSDIFVLNFEANVIDINYLILELNSEFVQKQVDRYSSGTTFSSIFRKDVLNLKIRILNLEEQRKKVIEYLDSLYRKKEEELTAFKRKNNLKSKVYKEIGYLKHSLGTPLLNIDSYIDILGIKLSKITDITIRSEFQKYANEIKNQLRLVNNLLEKNETELNPYNYKLKECDLIVFLTEYLQTRKNDVFKLELSISHDIKVELQQSVLINANKDLLSIMFNNILENANRHAFKNQKTENKLVRIELELDFDNDRVPIALLSIKNNGVPFPENFDKEKFIQKDLKAGDTGNTGIGGYDIFNITEYFNAKFELKLNEDKAFPTCYEIAFTIKNTKEIADEEI